MIQEKSKSRAAFLIFNAIFMIFMIIITLYPLMYVVFASLSVPTEFIAHSGLLLRPVGFSTISYERAFLHPLLLSGFANTLFVLVVGTVISTIFTACGAYVLSRTNLLWRKQISFLIIFTMYFSGGLIPFYFTVKDFSIAIPWISRSGFIIKEFKLYNSLWALIIPTMINTYNMIVLRTGFMSIPSEIEEAARIDGAGHLKILFRIFIPLARASIAVIILYYGVAYWNAWFNASIFIQNQEKYPIQLVLRQILFINAGEGMTAGVDMGEQLAVSETLKYSVIIIATVPILVVYPFLQKYFVKGVMVGAVKG